MPKKKAKSKPETPDAPGRCGGRRPSSCSVSAVDEWWAHHAGLLAPMMKLTGVKSFQIKRQRNGKYAFSVDPE